MLNYKLNNNLMIFSFFKRRKFSEDIITKHAKFLECYTNDLLLRLSNKTKGYLLIQQHLLALLEKITEEGVDGGRLLEFDRLSTDNENHLNFLLFNLYTLIPLIN